MWFIKDRVRTISSFSLYTISLLITLVTYFRSGLGKLSRLRLLESGKIYHYQYWKKVLVLVDFQNKANIV